jgi:hypothetical protein
MTPLQDDLRKRQSNILPPNLIANDHFVDDVLWNGPESGSCIQRAGGIVIGGMLMISSLVAVDVFYQRGARLLLIPFVALAAGGARIMYKALTTRGKGRPSE